VLDSLPSHGSCHPEESCRPPPRPVSSSGFPLAQWSRRDGLPPSLYGHYSASTLLRGSPSLSVASVLSPLWFKPLLAFPLTATARFPRSIQPPRPGSAHLYAGCRSVRKQVSPELIPRSSNHRGFDIVFIFSTRTMVPLRSSSWKSPDPIKLRLFLHRSPPHPLEHSSGRRFESNSCKSVRGALPHQLYSYTKQSALRAACFARGTVRKSTSTRVEAGA
jgi:hypothetical protein